MDRIEVTGLNDVFGCSYFKPWQADDVCSIVQGVSLREGQCPLLTKKEGTRDWYYNIPIAFDTETTSFRDKDNQKAATMYEWSLSVCGLVIIGRTWEEFDYVMNVLYERFLEFNPSRRLVIYVHNLAYDFQFFRKRFKWKKVFALDYYNPIYALDERGFEFRCSYKLTNKNLKTVAEELNDENLLKLVGDLDYDKIRHSQTPLTEKELDYCVHDVQIIVEHIARCIHQETSICNIPLTMTGYVRRECRQYCLSSESYKNKISSLLLYPDVYNMLKKCFQGGFTHANAFYVERLCEFVASMDITSSYPTVLITEKYPMGSARKVEVHSAKEYTDYALHYCCMFGVEITGVEPKIKWENPLSASRCKYEKHGSAVNNGRIVKADKLVTYLTDVDFEVVNRFYKFKSIKFFDFYIFEKNYLPTEFVDCILKFYKKKTKLKDKFGYEAEYQYYKSMVNSLYGMSVTDIIRMQFDYDMDEWNVKTKQERDDWQEQNLETKLKKYNNDKQRFLYYPWGVWCTAYARRNLFNAIAALGKDYIYSDTDSVKFLNYDLHKQWFDDYNKVIDYKMKKALDFHGLPIDSYKPKNMDGDECPLGYWSFEGIYPRFLTLGSKRYLVELPEKKKKKKHQTYELTCAGVSKSEGLKFLTNAHTYKILKFSLDKSNIDLTNLKLKPKQNPFDFFNFKTIFPANRTGKMIHTYCDENISGTITDYLGNTCAYKELSYVHLENTAYDMRPDTQDFIDFFCNFQREEGYCG